MCPVLLIWKSDFKTESSIVETWHLYTAFIQPVNIFQNQYDIKKALNFFKAFWLGG